MVSFGWGARAFFVRTAGLPFAAKLIVACYVVFALLHYGAIRSADNLTAGRTVAAAAMYLGALGLFWWAVRVNRSRPLSAAFSPDAPQFLVQAGPYRYIRHPFYSSYLAAWTAGVIATGDLWLTPTVAVLLTLYLRAITLEERKFLHSHLAGAYSEYRRRTGCLVPNPIKMIFGGRGA